MGWWHKIGKELRAKHPMSNMQIVERFIHGIRYMKITPKSMLPLILQNLKKMFVDKPVEFEVSESGWIKIVKTGVSEEMKTAVEKNLSKDEIENLDEDFILNKEAEMLKNQGFEVKIIEV